MKIIQLTLFLVLSCLPFVTEQSLAAVGIGDLYFSILSEEDKTVEVFVYQGMYPLPKIHDLKIPSTVEINGVEYQVIAIKKKGFKNVQSVYNSIEIPSSVKIIGDEAFSRIKNVDEVILHEGLDSIGKCAFELASIKKMKMPSTATKLGKDIFADSDLQEIRWPAAIQTIPNGCFRYTKLNRFDFTHIKEIGYRAFYGCDFLEEVVIPRGCRIGESAFESCKIKHVTFEELPKDIPLSSDNRIFIDESAFAYSTWESKRIVLPRCMGINRWAFMDCNSVQTIVIHDEVWFKDVLSFCGALKDYDPFEVLPTWIPDSIIYLTANPEKTYDIFQDVMYRETTLYVKPEALEKARNTYPWSKFRKIEVLSSGIDDIPADTDDGQNGPDLFYNLEGIPCGSDRNALPQGIYILRNNGKTSKIVI